jgi:hypothetical protein
MTGRAAPARIAAISSIPSSSHRSVRRAVASLVDRRGVGAVALQVDRHLDVNRPGAARLRDVERAIERTLHLVDAVGVEPALGDRPQDAREVGVALPLDLLEHPRAVHVGLHAAGDRDDRLGIDIGRRERGREVRRPRADRRHRRQRCARDPVIRIGEVPGGLLVPDLDRLDAARPVLQRIEDAHVAVARDAEDVGHALRDEVVGDDLAAGTLRHVVS